MISRVAEGCFWLHRHVERMENTARLLDVNRALVLDVRMEPGVQWFPIIVVSGEEARFGERFGGGPEAAQGEAVEHYLTWDPDNPVSIVSSLGYARENARTLREVISLEMWEALNGFWHWVRGGEGREAYDSDRSAFYRRVKSFSAAFQGLGHNTILHDEPFDFMRLGAQLERTGQTARIADVYYHRLGPEPGRDNSPQAAAHWMALLRSCSAVEPFFKVSRAALSGPSVMAFLLIEDRFPRSLAHCVNRSWNFLKRIRRRGDPAIGVAAAERLRGLATEIADLEWEGAKRQGVHALLTRIVGETSAICDQVHAAYFDPTWSEPADAPLRPEAQSQ